MKTAGDACLKDRQFSRSLRRILNDLEGMVFQRAVSAVVVGIRRRPREERRGASVSSIKDSLRKVARILGRVVAFSTGGSYGQNETDEEDHTSYPAQGKLCDGENFVGKSACAGRMGGLANPARRKIFWSCPKSGWERRANAFGTRRFAGRCRLCYSAQNGRCRVDSRPPTAPVDLSFC
jgi:hypothetical protein